MPHTDEGNNPLDLQIQRITKTVLSGSADFAWNQISAGNETTSETEAASDGFLKDSCDSAAGNV